MGYRLDLFKNELTYLYQLERGAAPSSFGLNVAKIAGLPVIISIYYFLILIEIQSDVLENAMQKSKEMSERIKFLVLTKDNQLREDVAKSEAEQNN